MIRCGWGKPRVRFSRCGVCRRPVVFGRLASLDLEFRQGGGYHWCGHARCVGRIRDAAAAMAQGAVIRPGTALLDSRGTAPGRSVRPAG